MISKEEIGYFNRKLEKFVKIRKPNKNNTLNDWWKYRNPARLALNYFIISICRHVPPSELKNSLYRLIGVKIGKNVGIGMDVIMDPFYPDLIFIGSGAIIGWGVKIFTHEFTNQMIKFGSVIIGKKSMIGQFSVIRPGIHIGNKSLVGAVSFINKDVPNGKIMGGVPIKIINIKSKAKKKIKKIMLSVKAYKKQLDIWNNVFNR